MERYLYLKIIERHFCHVLFCCHRITLAQSYPMFNLIPTALRKFRHWISIAFPWNSECSVYNFVHMKRLLIGCRMRKPVHFRAILCYRFRFRPLSFGAIFQYYWQPFNVIPSLHFITIQFVKLKRHFNLALISQMCCFTFGKQTEHISKWLFDVYKWLVLW